jgi:hypothetical protein
MGVHQGKGDVKGSLVLPSVTVLRWTFHSMMSSEGGGCWPWSAAGPARESPIRWKPRVPHLGFGSPEQ